MSSPQDSSQSTIPPVSSSLITKATSLAAATHLSSTQLTPTLIRHRFHLTPALSWTPSQHIELQLPADLDPTGSTYSDPTTGRMIFTPCNHTPHLPGNNIGGSAVSSTDVGTCARETMLLNEVEFISGAGRVASLIGLPRFLPLTAEVLEVGGGFLCRGGFARILESGAAVAVAGGSGIAPFVTIESDRRLLWSVRAIDAEMVAKLAGELRGWRKVKVFITGAQSYREAEIKRVLNGTELRYRELQLAFRRMNIDDLELEKVEDIFFCGGKALEWQVKMWAMKMKTRVVTTSR